MNGLPCEARSLLGLGGGGRGASEVCRLRAREPDGRAGSPAGAREESGEGLERAQERDSGNVRSSR